jgi:hypothetical protein
MDPTLLYHYTKLSTALEHVLLDGKIRFSRGALRLTCISRAFNEVLSTTSEPYGIGVAWGEQLEPTHDEITLCTRGRPAGGEGALGGSSWGSLALDGASEFDSGPDPDLAEDVA